MPTNAVTRIAMIGLGAMGLQMARHMAQKGFAVRGYDVDLAEAPHAVRTSGRFRVDSGARV